MIKKELFHTEDGVVLYRTYSDTGHRIRNVNTGVVYDDAVDIEEKEYEELSDYVKLEGPDTYEEVLDAAESAEVISRKINRINMTTNEALSVKEMFPKWESFIGCTIEVGFITLFADKLWRARQTHTALAMYPPSLDTASLYEVIEAEHNGTADDPIPYTPPMKIFAGKYYTQDGVLYLCTRDSGIVLTHKLGELIGLYVDRV